MDRLRDLWDKWCGIRMGYRVNALLYALAGVSLLALVLELVIGGGSATTRVRVVSQSPSTTRAAAATTIPAAIPTTTITLPPATTTPTTSGQSTAVPNPFLPNPNDALSVGPRDAPEPTEPRVEPTAPVQTTVPPTTTPPTTGPSNTTTSVAAAAPAP